MPFTGPPPAETIEGIRQRLLELERSVNDAVVDLEIEVMRAALARVEAHLAAPKG